MEFLFAAQPAAIAAWLARQPTIACLPHARGSIDAYPSDIRVKAVKITVVQPPVTAVTPIGPGQPPRAPMILEKKGVILDLTQKRFYFPPPEVIHRRQSMSCPPTVSPPASGSAAPLVAQEELCT